MVVISDGRFELPDNLLYSSQHVYLDKDNKIIGLDQLGYAYLKNPRELTILAEKEIKIGEPIAAITTEQGITTLMSPCSGKIKSVNHDALDYMENDTYNKGFLIKLETIDEIDSSLITQKDLERWAKSEAKVLFHGFYAFKVILIGDSATGKTAIKVRFTDDYFKKDLKTTLGVDFGSKELKCEYTSPDVMFSGVHRFTAKMSVWDAAGQKHYEKMRGMYYRGAKGAMIVYDVNNPVSFDNLDFWVNELEENLGRRVPTLLVANKLDLERKVPKEKAEAYAKEKGFLYFECSAKTGEGVTDAFRQLAVEIYKAEEELE